MPAKKAAKKVAKKAAKKSARHLPSHELRRAYEHLGRVDILEGALAGIYFRHVSALAGLAQQHLVAGHERDAADMLRAAEHICFAALAPEERNATATLVSPELRAAIAAELNDLIRSAQKHWSGVDNDEPHETIATIYATSLDQSRLSYSSGAYRPALELARAAEALAKMSARSIARFFSRRPARSLAS